ncbi:MAG: hypothetical protein HOP91_00395 [Sphingomonas sp.]|nr:hypothetical protein [Sphingomonas sp.]
MKKIIVCVLLLAAACKDNRPPTPTPEQSQQLNEAEDLLNNMTANEEGPEQRPGPSNSTD